MIFVNTRGVESTTNSDWLVITPALFILMITNNMNLIGQKITMSLWHFNPHRFIFKPTEKFQLNYFTSLLLII